MNPSARPQTSRNRDRALAKLRSITTGTAVAASIATAGFGGLAALTYSGTSNAGSSDTTVPAGVSLDGTTTSGTTTNTTNTNITRLQPTAAPVTTTRTKTHVTSGGSGW